MKKTTTCATLAAAILAGCVYYDLPQVKPMAMPWGQTVQVACQDGRRMAIEFVPAPRAARVSFDATTLTLPQRDTAGDAEFSDGRYTLYINASRVALVDTAIVLRGPCAPL